MFFYTWAYVRRHNNKKLTFAKSGYRNKTQNTQITLTAKLNKNYD